MLILSFSPHPLCAQDTTAGEHKTFIWGSTGGGLGSLGLSGYFRLAYQKNIVRFSFRYAGTLEWFIFGATPEEQGTDVALMCGLSSENDRLSGAISVGAALVRTVRRGNFISHGFLGDEYERIEKSTIGLPVEANFTGVIFPAFGLGSPPFLLSHLIIS